MTDGSWRLLSTHPPEKPPKVTSEPSIQPHPYAHVRLLILCLIFEQRERALCPLSTQPNEERLHLYVSLYLRLCMWLSVSVSACAQVWRLRGHGKQMESERICTHVATLSSVKRWNRVCSAKGKVSFGKRVCTLTSESSFNLLMFIYNLGFNISVLLNNLWGTDFEYELSISAKFLLLRTFGVCAISPCSVNHTESAIRPFLDYNIRAARGQCPYFISRKFNITANRPLSCKVHPNECQRTACNVLILNWVLGSVPSLLSFTSISTSYAEHALIT